MIDPYPLPFTWSENFELVLLDISGLLPCLCESGWLPLLDGSYVACEMCKLESC